MIYTNKHGLPEEVYNALSRNRYISDSIEVTTKTDYSVTTLGNPVQQTILKKRHSENLTADVIDQVWSMFGSIAHTLLEEHGSDTAVTEKRFYTTVLGKTISGQIDHYKDGVITDYKTTSVYKVKKRSYTEWEAQLNCYAHLCRKNSLPIRNLRIIAIIRDWSEAYVDTPDYPKAPIVEIPLTVWDDAIVEEYMLSRVQELICNENKADSYLLKCTPEEMWQTESVFAVMKDKDAKRSKKNCSTYEEAINYASGDEIVVERQGERRRCEKYCVAKDKCFQYKEFKNV